MKKQIFTHNKKLDKEHVQEPFEKFKVPGFYNVDREGLLEVMPLDQRLSQYIIPDPHTPDHIVLATIIRTMSTMTRYVAGRPVQITFSKEENAVSSAEGSGAKMTVALNSLFDHRLPFYSRLNVVFGLTFHEANHVAWTTPGIAKMLMARGLVKSSINSWNGKQKKIPDFTKTKDLYEDNNLLAMLFNIVEDRRIERLGLQRFPGYVFYMDELHKYASWMHTNMLTDKDFKIDESNPDQYWGALTQYISYKSGLPVCVPLFDKKAPKDSKFLELRKKVDEILSGPDSSFEDAMTMAKKLFDLYPQDQKDKNKGMGKSAACEMGENPELGPKDQQGKPDKQQEEQIEAVAKEVRNEQSETREPIDKVMTAKGDKHYSHFGTHPAKKGEFDKKVYDEALEISRTIAKNLTFLDSRFNRTTECFELTSGNLDEDELYSLQHNRAIFTEDEESPGYSMDLCILIDESGSMGWGSKIHQAKVAGMALALALQHNEFINLYVYGHTADHKDGENISLYRYLDPQEKATDINTLFSIRSRSNNADGYAIAKMGEILKKGKARQKVLIVISDGQPAAGCYGDGIGHTRDMVTMLEKKDIFVVQICVDNVEASPKMFTHFVPFNKQKLGVNLRKVLMKKLVEISNQI